MRPLLGEIAEMASKITLFSRGVRQAQEGDTRPPMKGTENTAFSVLLHKADRDLR